ncbi:hypothetical protein SAMN06265218_11871 [Fodinibius sediminis]|uniref:Uncharacterized protein n=1 Tax=Fodinibius sediminis TaxID=1214077 RepID=A0A521EU68_9BACT|nr:hypothetical protein SAMN06265218_11871 [Fodinibius sediminis]
MFISTIFLIIIATILAGYLFFLALQKHNNLSISYILTIIVIYFFILSSYLKSGESLFIITSLVFIIIFQAISIFFNWYYTANKS